MPTYRLGKFKITPKGEYNEKTTYNELDLIKYNGSSYLVLQTITGVTPSDDNVNYQAICEPSETLSANDENPIKSKAVYAEINLKQDKLTNSNIGSGLGIDSNNKLYVPIDTELSADSQNPVENNVLSATFDSFNANIEQNTVNIANLQDGFTGLQERVDGDYQAMVETTNALDNSKQTKMGMTDTLTTVLQENIIYNLGTVSTPITISFPTITESDGQVIYINFECSSAITLTIDTSNTTAIDIVPEANKGYEIFGSWNGTRWVLGYDEYDIPTTSTTSEEETA